MSVPKISKSPPAVEDAARSCLAITRAFQRDDLPNGAVMYSRTTRFVSARGHWMIMINKNRKGLNYTLSPEEPGLRRAAIYNMILEDLSDSHEAEALKFHGRDRDLLACITLRMPIPAALRVATLLSDTYYYRLGPLSPEQLKNTLLFDDWLRNGLRESSVTLDLEHAVELDRAGHFFAA